jgi:hypothetical protein
LIKDLIPPSVKSVLVDHQFWTKNSSCLSLVAIDVLFAVISDDPTVAENKINLIRSTAEIFNLEIYLERKIADLSTGQ